MTTAKAILAQSNGNPPSPYGETLTRNPDRNTPDFEKICVCLLAIVGEGYYLLNQTRICLQFNNLWILSACRNLSAVESAERRFDPRWMAGAIKLVRALCTYLRFGRLRLPG